MSIREIFLHTYKKCFVFLSKGCESHRSNLSRTNQNCIIKSLERKGERDRDQIPSLWGKFGRGCLEFTSQFHLLSFLLRVLKRGMIVLVFVWSYQCIWLSVFILCRSRVCVHACLRGIEDDQFLDSPPTVLLEG